ncbi:RNA recognition motif domain containing protein, putative [Babesia ovis]|uniref:RNA recognition motif domain containing protein, putative n=1 Tax=Babesia ovis TaxID=5869 RepID=A0A9W5TBR6_BABOV|nr:RNA recognition motif domain containing protein, putative [Babesia ovis]
MEPTSDQNETVDLDVTPSTVDDKQVSQSFGTESHQAEDGGTNPDNTASTQVVTEDGPADPPTGNNSDQPETETSTPQKPVVSNADITKLNELVELFVCFAAKISESRADDEDDEEGAVEEDEVPFERIADRVTHSNIVHLLNLPPEMEMDALASAIGGITDLVLHCFPFRATELKMIFVTPALASEARRLLDSRRLHNRTIQAVLSNAEDFNPPQQPIPAPLVPIPPLPLVKLPQSLRGPPPLPPAFPLPPLPPGVTPPLPLLPPGRLPDANDRMLGPGPHLGGLPMDHPKMLFGRNVFKRKGKTLYDMLSSITRVCNWSPEQTLEEQQSNYDILNTEHGITNRYLLLGGLPDTVTENLNTAKDWLMKHTQKKVDIEICRLEKYAAELKLSNDLFLHLTFQRRTDCIELYNMLIILPNITCRYSAPRKAYDTLWIGNIADALSYCRDEFDMKDLFSRIGDMRSYRYVPDKACFFVTYGTVEDAISARNELVGISFSGTKSMGLNVDFTLDVPPRFVPRSRPSQPEIRNSPNGDFSQKLGERLLSALQKRSDGDMVIRQLLDGHDSDAVNLLKKGQPRHYQPRGHDSRHDMPRHPRGPPVGPSGQNNWNKSRKRPYPPPDHPQDHYKHRRAAPQRGDFSPNEFGHSVPHRSDSSPSGYGPPGQRDPGYRFRPQSPRSPKQRPTEEKLPAETQGDPGASRSKPRMLLCNLLKRGKPICKVSAVFVRGDMSHRLPQTLDVNQRANPERLGNYLQKTPELSMWQLGADSSEDSMKYDSLCDYLISKNRVALVQEGPYEIYIVPPSENSPLSPNLPDTQFMYAFVLPKGS